MLFSEVLEFVVKNRDKGRSGSFDFPDNMLAGYIVWAFRMDYLFTTYKDGKLTSVAVAAPLNKNFDPERDKFISFDRQISIMDEREHPIGILDYICTDSGSHKEMIEKGVSRFDNFLHKDKWAMRFGNIIKLPNRYFNHLYYL
jgi:hypothetical protein